MYSCLVIKQCVLLYNLYGIHASRLRAHFSPANRQTFVLYALVLPFSVPGIPPLRTIRPRKSTPSGAILQKSYLYLTRLLTKARLSSILFIMRQQWEGKLFGRKFRSFHRAAGFQPGHAHNNAAHNRGYFRQRLDRRAQRDSDVHQHPLHGRASGYSYERPL